MKFHSKQMVTFAMGYPDNFRSQISRTLGNGGRSCKRGARDFERNLRCWPKRAMYRNQGSAGGDIYRGGKFEEVFAALIAAADKNGDGKG